MSDSLKESEKVVYTLENDETGECTGIFSSYKLAYQTRLRLSFLSHLRIHTRVIDYYVSIGV